MTKTTETYTILNYRSENLNQKGTNNMTEEDIHRMPSRKLVEISHSMSITMKMIRDELESR